MREYMTFEALVTFVVGLVLMVEGYVACVVLFSL